MKNLIAALALILTAGTAQAEWKETITVDEFTGAETVLAMTNSLDNYDVGNLMLRSRSGKLDIYFSGTDSYICSPGGQLFVMYKFDDGQVYENLAGLSSSNRALFFDLSPTEAYKWHASKHTDLSQSEFLSKMEQSTTLTVRYQDTCGELRTFKFDTTNG